jgi:hypothetical protein
VTRLTAVLVACVALLAACGPTGPNDPQGEPADPVELLGIVPVPNGLTETTPAGPATPAVLLQAMTGASDPRVADRLFDSGLEEAGVRRFGAPGGGELAATVSVWPSKLIASNLALEVAQQRLGEEGVRAWTPQDVPGSQGIRERGGARERIVGRAVGPNAIVLRATGDVPDDAVERTLRRLVQLQENRGG